MQEREYMGVWWLEDNPQIRIPGTLEYDPSDGITLRLMGDFADTIVTSSHSIEEFDKILGVTEEGDSITLVDCPRDSTTLSSSSQRSVYKPRFLIEGVIFQNANPALDKMTISFYGMNQWAGLTRIRPGDNILEDPEEVKTNPTLMADVPPPLTAWVDDIQIRLAVDVGLPIELLERGELVVNNLFIVNPRAPLVPFKDYVGHINELNNFVALGLGHPTDVKSVSGVVRTLDGNKYEVDIFYQIQGRIHRDFSIHPLRMPFRGPDIADDFDRIMNLWYGRSEELSEIFSLYFGTVFQDTMYPQNRLLSLCHGLESYHRKRFNSTYMHPADYAELYEDLIDLLKGDPSSVYSSLGSSSENLQTTHGIPTPFVQALEDGTLLHANEKSLRRRLRDVIRAIEPVLTDLPYSLVGKHERTAATRNFLVHRTDELRQKAAHGAERLELIWGLQQLIEVCLLLEIGIPPDLIRERISSKYKNLWVS